MIIERKATEQCFPGLSFFIIEMVGKFEVWHWLKELFEVFTG